MRMLGRAFRKLVFCSHGIHCRMVYDSGLPNDIGRAGTCTDCGYRQDAIVWSKPPSYKCAKCDTESASQITIESDGTARGTEVKLGGQLVNGVSKVEMSPLKCDGVVKATITINAPILRMRIKEAAVNCDGDILLEEQIKAVLLGTNGDSA